VVPETRNQLNRNLSRRLSELAPEHTAAFAAGNQRNFRIDLVIWAGADWAGLILEFKLNTNIAGDVCRTAAFLHWANHTAIDGYQIACCIAPAMSDFDKYEVQLCDQSGLHRDGRVLRLDPVRLYSNPAWADDPALCGIFAVKVKATAVA
jgi:hypothetical protein